MLSRSTRVRLIAFVMIALVTVLYVGGKYAGLDRLFGSRGYLVTADVAEGSGIARGSEVAYRGVTVGSVTALRLKPSGVDIEMDIDSDSPPIPADTLAVITHRSAVGEQYVDLRPRSSTGPYLEDGAVIDRESTQLPVSPDTMLANVDRLVSSLNTDSLRTVVNESYDAFAGTGPQLQQLLDSTQSFTASATDAMPDLRGLLSSARTVLDTQQRHADDIGRFSSGLRTIADQFEKSDPDLRAIIDRAPRLGRQISDLLDRSGNDLGMLLANMHTTANVTSVRSDALEQLMVNFAVIGAFAQTASLDGRGQLGLVFDMFDPPSCTRGYEGTQQRPADDLTEVRPNMDAYCAEPPGSPIAVRGSQNAPYGGVPVAVEPPADSGSGASDGDSADADLPGLLGLPGTQSRAGGVAGLLGAP